MQTRGFPRILLSGVAALAASCVLSLAHTHVARAHGTLHETLDELRTLPTDIPASAHALLERGELKRLAGDRAGAQADYDAVEAIAPGFAGLLPCRAALALDCGDPEAAVRMLDRHASLFPNDAHALVLRAEAHTRAGRERAALGDYDLAFRTLGNGSARPRADWVIERARLAERLDGPEAALAGLEESLSRAGDDPALLGRALEIELALGRNDGALARLDRLLARAERREFLLAQRGDILRRAGRPLEADAAYTEALDALERVAPARQSERTRVLAARIEQSLREVRREP